MNEPAIRPVGEAAVLIEFSNEISQAAHARVIALDRAIAAEKPAGLLETVPAYTSLLAIFDPEACDHRTVGATLQRLAARAAEPARMRREHVIPVCYDDGCGPDIPALANRLGLSESEIIEHHLAGDYSVYMYGFAPGYAYMGGVPIDIRAPRKPSAERGHPVGSVLIAAGQCLVTTLPMPTGWWVIGRSPLLLMDIGSDRPFLLEPGDHVRFERISAQQFAARAAR